MEAEGRQKVDLEFEALGCVENIHFLENQVDPDQYDWDDFPDDGKQVVMSLAADVDSQFAELHESTEPVSMQAHKRYNLRKSLAWDTAFFTSAGVLDSEELSSMISGADKGEKHWLPGIQEDITDSTESISNLESDNLNLETLEEDLFVDIRASIKRSSKKMSDLTNSSEKKPDMDVDSAPILTLEKEAVASQNKNPKPGPRKTSGLETKSLPKQNAGKQGSGKALKQDSGHSQTTSIAKIGEKVPVITNKPKTIIKSISTSTTAKWDSKGTNLGKSERGISKHGTQAVTSSKGNQPRNVCDGTTRTMPRPTMSSKPSLLGSSTASRLQSARSSSSSDSSSSMSSGTIAKPQLMMAKRNPWKSSIGPSGSTPKMPTRAVGKNKAAPSTLSAYVMSNRISSSVSPASSISEWSSVSSSSSSSVANNRFNNSRTRVDTNSCVSIDGDINLLHQRNPSSDRHKSQGVTSPCSNSKIFTAKGILLASMKPSGLRMPSPKIGFFDGGVKSSPNSNQLSEFGIRTVLPKNGTACSSPIRTSSSLLKCPKTSTTRMATCFSSTKQDSPQSL